MSRYLNIRWASCSAVASKSRQVGTAQTSSPQGRQLAEITKWWRPRINSLGWHQARLQPHIHTGWVKKTTTRLTAYSFKTSYLICVIFGKIKLCFILNTSVMSVLNKFITQVAPPGDKINNSLFHLQNQTETTAFNAVSLKYLHQFAQFLAQLNAVIFWTCPLCHFHQLLSTK